MILEGTQKPNETDIEFWQFPKDLFIFHFKFIY